MVHIVGLGSFREVGRSSILVAGSQRFLMDYGLCVEDMRIPLRPKVDLSGVFISHAHLDHCGVLPELYKRGYQGKMFAIAPTLDLASLMLYDALKVQEKRKVVSHFQPHDIETMERLSQSMEFGKPREFKDAEVTMFDAGHVPGSAATLIEMDGKRILYTGDIKFSATELMPPAFMGYKDIDLLICESTYTQKDHPDRAQLRKELLMHALDVVNSGGVLLMPAFAIGRTQELLQIVADLDVPLTLDGLGAKATQEMLQYPSSVRDHKKLKKAFGKAHKIKSHADRFKVVKQPGIILTTAGMMNGGPISFYMKKLHDDPRSSLYLSGYQVEKTVGRILQDTGRYVAEGLDVKPKLQVQFRDWSAHAGRTELLQFLKKVKPKKTIFNHGQQAEAFAKEVTEMGYPAFAPENGEKFEL